MNVRRTAFSRGTRAGAGLTAGLMTAAALLLGGCSGGSASSTGVPGAPGSGGGSRSTAAAGAVDGLVAEEQPASAALMPSGSTAAKIRSRGTLVVGGTRTAALFSLLDPTTGRVDGFDAAMSQLLAKYIIGRPATKLVDVTSATREALLRSHQVDTVFATYTITPERAEVVAFAGPYYEDGLAIEVRKSGKALSSPEDLAGRTVVTQSGSTAAAAVKKAAPGAKIQLFDTNTECLQALQQGRADAYVLDQGILAGNAARNPDVTVSGRTFSHEPYGIGLPLGDPGFKHFVDDWLRKIESDGTWAKVWRATVGTEVPGAAPAPPRID
ncbi:glutamate ABC transporter substrate-binding protein [Streptomyces sp. NPDC090108]|uniref:glutamate ABC transporter substrate-binding protein n=1 Tax=Streptomyces sp. NPDC090108 TaxID=3365947 RepID=UPI003827714D